MAHFPTIDSELLRTFTVIADQGGFTRAADQLNRTQSAVSMQMKRLEEDVIQRPLFSREGRHVHLTAEGEMLLGYARRILRLQGEALNSLRTPDMVGLVRIGTPDDYVARFLPGVLARFARSFPLVQVEMHCEPSAQLLQRHDLDLTIVTREPGKEIGELLRQEQLVWAQACGAELQHLEQLPLAMFNGDCFCRHWACNALEAQQRNYRVAYTSPSLSAIFAVVGAGLAITAQPRSLIPDSMQVLGPEHGLPEMPQASIVLLRNTPRSSAASESLAAHVIEGFRH